MDYIEGKAYKDTESQECEEKAHYTLEYSMFVFCTVALPRPTVSVLKKG